MKPPAGSRDRRHNFPIIHEAPTPDKTLSPRELVQEERTTWLSFIDFIEARKAGRWVFRGCGSHTFGLVPSAGRSPLTYNVDQELRIFRAFQKSAGLYIDQLPQSEWDWLALAQHYGLPTRLLDWTTNPLVAGFFGVASGPSDHNAVIYAHQVRDEDVIDPIHATDPFGIKMVGFLLPDRSVRRIVSQRGLFTAHSDPSTPWNPPELSANNFTIPARQRLRFRNRLAMLGVDDSHIYADLAGLCLTLKWRYDNQLGIGSLVLG